MDAMVVLCDSWLWRMPLVDANDGCGFWHVMDMVAKGYF